MEITLALDLGTDPSTPCEFSAEELSRGYVLPPNAGPACREAWEYGLDLSLLEETLRMTQRERLLANERARQQVLLLNPNWLDEPRPDEYGFSFLDVSRLHAVLERPIPHVDRRCLDHSQRSRRTPA